MLHFNYFEYVDNNPKMIDYRNKNIKKAQEKAREKIPITLHKKTLPKKAISQVTLEGLPLV